MKEPEPRRQPVFAAATRTIAAAAHINEEFLALYRVRKAENRPRNKGRRFHWRDKKLEDRIAAKPNRSEIEMSRNNCLGPESTGRGMELQSTLSNSNVISMQEPSNIGPMAAPTGRVYNKKSGATVTRTGGVADSASFVATNQRSMQRLYKLSGVGSPPTHCLQVRSDNERAENTLMSALSTHCLQDRSDPSPPAVKAPRVIPRMTRLVQLPEKRRKPPLVVSNTRCHASSGGPGPCHRTAQSR